jgi:C4-dicarboxylate-binding protein DctP
VTNHGVLVYAVIVNQRFWLGLPPAIRSTLEGALRDATDYANQIAEAENREALRRIADSGRIVVRKPSDAELMAWRRALAPTWSVTESWIGADTLAAVKRAAGASP